MSNGDSVNRCVAKCRQGPVFQSAGLNWVNIWVVVKVAGGPVLMCLMSEVMSKMPQSLIDLVRAVQSCSNPEFLKLILST